MDHIKIIKRSWEILWRYRALWVFGILLALATAGSSGGSGNAGMRYSDPGNGSAFIPPSNGVPGGWEDGFREFGRMFSGDFLARLGTALVVIGIVLVCILLLLGIATYILGYVARTALIRMVDEYEQTEQRRTVGEGFRMGWSRAALRVFLIDLVIHIPLLIASILLILLALSPLLLWLTGNDTVGVLGTVAGIGLVFLVILLIILVSVVVNVLLRFFHRVTVLEGLGVFESIATGYRLAVRNFKDTALMWLILLGLQIAYGIATAILGFVLLIPAIILGGGVTLLIGGLGALLAAGPVFWVLAALIGLPAFLFFLVLPLLFLGGLKEVYINNAWTLTYRELRPAGGLLPAPEAHEPLSAAEEDDLPPADGEDAAPADTGQG